MHKCGAKIDTGKCNRLIGNKYKFCHEHRSSPSTSYGEEVKLQAINQEKRLEVIEFLWDDIEELMDVHPDITLSQIFNYIQDSALDEGVNLGREYVINWYRKNQERNGHPIELTYRENIAAYRSKPYKQILESGIPRPKKSIVLEYAKQNPEDNYRQISIETGVSYQSVQKILKKAELPRSRWSIINKPKEKAVLEFHKENPDCTFKEILDDIDVSSSHLRRIAKAHGLKIITSKNKGHRAIEYINQNPDCSMNEVMENVGISEARLRVVLDKEKIKLKSDEDLVLNYLKKGNKPSIAKIIGHLKITPHSLYKISIKHDLYFD